MTTIKIEKKTDQYEVFKAMQKIADNARKIHGKKDSNKGLAYIHYNGEIGRFEASDGRVLLTYWWTPEELTGVHSALFEFKAECLVDSGESYYFPECRRVIPNISGEFNSYGERYENVYQITPGEFSDNYGPADYRFCAILGHYGVQINGKYAEIVKNILPRFSYLALSVTTDGKLSGRYNPVMLHGSGMEYVVMPLTPNWNQIPVDVPERTEKTA